MNGIGDIEYHVTMKLLWPTWAPDNLVSRDMKTYYHIGCLPDGDTLKTERFYKDTPDLYVCYYPAFAV